MRVVISTPIMLPATTSHNVWMESFILCLAIRKAIKNVRTMTTELFVKNVIMVHIENAIDACPDGMPPRSGVPLRESVFTC